jgi:hypothetical protein
MVEWLDEARTLEKSSLGRHLVLITGTFKAVEGAHLSRDNTVLTAALGCSSLDEDWSH